MRSLDGITFLVGDLHGKQQSLIQSISKYDIRDSNIIILGDCGMGFYKNPLKKDYAYLQRNLEVRNNRIFLVRGNHDNPDHWSTNIKNTIEAQYPNVNILQDGEIILINEKQYLIIGGATSIDRFSRKEGTTYWPDETIEMPIVSSDTNIFGILSHIGPTPPICIDNNLNSFFANDIGLSNDLRREQELINDIIVTIKPQNWYFGHFHITQNFCHYNMVTCQCLGELVFIML